MLEKLLLALESNLESLDRKVSDTATGKASLSLQELQLELKYLKHITAKAKKEL